MQNQIKFRTKSFIDGDRVYITGRSKLLCYGPKSIKGTKTGRIYNTDTFLFQSPNGGLFVIARYEGEEILQVITKEPAREFYKNATVHYMPFDDAGIREA